MGCDVSPRAVKPDHYSAHGRVDCGRDFPVFQPVDGREKKGLTSGRRQGINSFLYPLIHVFPPQNRRSLMQVHDGFGWHAMPVSAQLPKEPLFPPPRCIARAKEVMKNRKKPRTGARLG